MLTERWSVFLFWKPLFMKASAYFWLSKNTQYFRQPLVLSLMHSDALSASISSLPCTCHGLDYSPLQVVAKTTAAHSGWMQKPSELHYGAECSNSQRTSVLVGGWLQRKLDQELNHMVQSIIRGTLTVSSKTKALICTSACTLQANAMRNSTKTEGRNPRRSSEQIRGGTEADGYKLWEALLLCEVLAEKTLLGSMSKETPV